MQKDQRTLVVKLLKQFIPEQEFLVGQMEAHLPDMNASAKGKAMRVELAVAKNFLIELAGESKQKDQAFFEVGAHYKNTASGNVVEVLFVEEDKAHFKTISSPKSKATGVFALRYSQCGNYARVP